VEKVQDFIHEADGVMYLENDLPTIYVSIKLTEENLIIIEQDN